MQFGYIYSLRTNEFGENQMNNFMSPQLNPFGYSVEQLMQLLPIGRTSIYKLIKFGELQTVVICGRRIIPATEVQRLMLTSDSETPRPKTNVFELPAFDLP